MELIIKFEIVENNGVIIIKTNDKDNGNNLAIIEQKNNEWIVTYSVLDELGILYNIDLLDIVKENLHNINNLERTLELSLFKYDALNRMFIISTDEDLIKKKRLAKRI